MKKSIILSLFILMALLNIQNGFSDLAGDIERAAKIIEDFSQIPEEAIPVEILKNCKGLAILTVGKAGFILSGRGGTGLVIAKTAQGWSAPSAIGTGGGGIGFQIGAQITDFVIVLNTDDAVDAFSRGGNVSLGGALSVAAGPVGRTAEGGVTPLAAVYTYSRSKGAFAGISLEGTVVVERKEANQKFYGRPLRSYEILSGQELVPDVAQTLVMALEKYSQG